MAVEDALRELDTDRNRETAWAFGEPLRIWATRENWRSCILLQHLETNARNLNTWNDLVRSSRLALADEAEFQEKARALLSPRSIRFNDVMEDLIGEMLAAMYLRSLGHRDIHFLSDDGPIHTDLRSIHENHTYVTEAKNLREPRGLTKVAFSRWNHNRAADPGRFAFTIELLDLDDPLGDLTSGQEEVVVALIDDLPEWDRPSRRIRDLPGGRRISITVREGRPMIATYGGGPFRVDGINGVVAEGRRGLVLKMLEQLRKALSQLYADAVPAEYRRLIFVRWKPPEQFVVAPEGLEEVRNQVQEGLRVFIRSSFPHFSIVIMHTEGEDVEQVPRAAWD